MRLLCFFFGKIYPSTVKLSQLKASKTKYFTLNKEEAHWPWPGFSVFLVDQILSTSLKELKMDYVQPRKQVK